MSYDVFDAQRAVRAAKDLGHRERLVYFVLTTHARQKTGKAWPSLNTIARGCDYGRNTVCCALDELERKGWLKRERRSANGHQSTVYTLTPMVVPETNKGWSGDEQGLVHEEDKGCPEDEQGLGRDVTKACSLAGHKQPRELPTQLPTEQRKRSTKKTDKPSAAADASVREVFDHWSSVIGSVIFKSREPKLTEDRKRAIRKGLKSKSVDELKLAIDGARLSDFHMGENNQGQHYADLETLFRKPATIDSHINRVSSPPPAKLSKVQIDKRPGGWRPKKEDIDGAA